MTTIDQLESQISKMIAAIGKGISSGSKAAGCTINILASESQMVISGDIAFTPGEVIVSRTKTDDAISTSKEERPQIIANTTSTKYNEQAVLTGNESLGTKAAVSITSNAVR